MKLHLIDGTYELFRAFFGAPSAKGPDGREVGATRGLLRSLVSLLRSDQVTHVGIAFDHVIESFRNELFANYKTGVGIDPDLLGQFPLAERVALALGLVVWPMIEFEADDALATAAARWEDADGVEQILLCSPDKDLAQCVRNQRVVLVDRRRERTIDESGVVEKWGVLPRSIPDFLALVGDSADGIPGIPRWGEKSAGRMLTEYGTLEQIPNDPEQWRTKPRGSAALAKNLRDMREDAMLYKVLATLRIDVPLTESLEQMRWPGANRQQLESLCAEIGEDPSRLRVRQWMPQ